MLSIENLSVAIEKNQVLNDVSLSIASNKIVGLIGRNGAGKTTLMRTIMGLLKSSNGAINFEDRNLLKIPADKRVFLGIGYMPEDRRLVPQWTVKQNILLPIWATRQYSLQNRFRWIFDLMPELTKIRRRKVLQLSGGQQKLVALARALVCGTKLLLLDEPFEGVAPALAQRLVEVISNLEDEGVTVLLSESDYTHSANLIDKLFVIERGEITEKQA